jgi:predicted peroxiredoxin
MADNMLIILTTGPEDRGNRATLAFAMGVAACISGVHATLYMTMGGTFWSRENAHARVHIEGFEPLATYVEQFSEVGGQIMVCSPCNEFYCSIASDSGLLPGAQLVGLTTIVDLALSSSVVTL